MRSLLIKVLEIGVRVHKGKRRSSGLWERTEMYGKVEEMDVCLCVYVSVDMNVT